MVRENNIQQMGLFFNVLIIVDYVITNKCESLNNLLLGRILTTRAQTQVGSPTGPEPTGPSPTGPEPRQTCGDHPQP